MPRQKPAPQRSQHGGRDLALVLIKMSLEDRVRVMVGYALIKSGRMKTTALPDDLTDAVTDALTRWRMPRVLHNPETYQPRGYTDYRVPNRIGTGTSRIARRSKQRGPCLTLGCDNSEITRGCCQRCYGPLARLVKLGRETWESLEATGKVLPRKRKVSK